MTTTKHRPLQTVFSRALRPLDDMDADFDENGAPPESRAIDPLAAQPLTADEIAQLTGHEPDVLEVGELIIDRLASETEADMPIDPDSAESLAPGVDEQLEIHRRPKAKDHEP